MALRGNEEKSMQTKKLQKSYFDVLGICCSSEIPLIENILKSLDGVKEFSVIVPSRTVIVVHDSLLISPHQIAKALNQARLEANVRINGETSFKKKWPSPFAVVSGGLLLLSFLKYVYPPLRWLAVGSVAAGIFPIMAKAFASIRRFRIDINILVIVAVIATIALKDYTESAAIVFLFTIADWLESRASYKASAVMQSLMNLAPQKAVIAETGEEVEVDEVKINTVLAVKAGETIPIDGVVMDGNCEVDEKTLTGEAFPVPKQRDSTVWAGTINLNGYISVKTTALAEDCVVAKMAKLVEEAQNSKTKTQRFIDQCSQYYTPAVVIISTCFAVVPVALRVHNLRHWFHLALVVLVSACPCGLVLSTPVATFCALTKAATSGLLIKGGDYLETLSKIKIAAFDKTGTITRGEFIVMDFRSLSRDISVHTLLYWVSSVESKSSHPMAAALVDYAKSVSVDPKPDAVEEYQNFPGEGIYGSIDGKDVFIGNKRIASRAGCSTGPDIEMDTKGGKTVGYIYVGERLSGVFNLSDACRSGVVQAMKELKSLGVKTAMLTGDNQAAAMHAQEQLGNALEVVHAELLPEDKARIIEQFKKEGLTAMVGDGLNDAPALATADIGISMGISGSALATQTGHIILMSNDIRKIPEAIKLARRAHQKVIQNVILSIVIKGGILILAFSGHPLIWAAVLADVGTCLLVILNSMLLLQEKNHSGKKCCRASPPALLMQKLEGGGNHDIETGLLGKRGDGHCNSGCCGENMGEKAVRPACTVEGLNRKRGSDHCHSGCCDKKLDDDMKLARQNWHTQLSDLRQAQKVKHWHNDSGCCGDKTTQQEEKIGSSSSCKKSALLEKELQVKSNSNCRSGCRVNKNEEAKGCCEKPDGTERAQPMKITENKASCCQKKVQTEEIMIQTFAENPAELRMKTDGNCTSSCCGKKEKAEEKILLPKEQRSDLEKSLRKKTEGTCKSGCCSNDKQTMETAKPAAVRKTDNQDCYSECCSNKHKEEQSSHEKTAEANCESVCCDNDVEGVGGAEGKQEGSVKSTSMERGLQLKNDQNCRSRCCQSKQEMECALNQSCCSSPVDILVSGLQAKSGSHSKSSCCESNDEAKEQSCCLEKSLEACRSKCGGGERRHNNGGCCRSFAKECCSHGHVGAAGFGGLTEIVIE